MPRMDQSLETDDLSRVLVYGPPLTKKTTWILKAAEAGFNIIYLGYDHNFQVAAQLSPAAQQRIYHFDLRRPVKSSTNDGGLAFIHAAKPAVTYFDETERVYAPAQRLVPEKTYAQIDLEKVTPNDIIVVDSWTALTAMVTSAGVVDPTKVAKLEWDDYARLRLLLDLFLQNLGKLNCHIVVIGHGETVGKRRKDAGAKEAPETAIEAIRTQVSSVSRGHGELMAKSFTDVLYFSAPGGSNGNVYISTKGSDDFDAGCRKRAPFKALWADFQFKDLVPAAMLPDPTTNVSFSSAAITAATGAEFAANRTTNAAIPVGANPVKMAAPAQTALGAKLNQITEKKK